MKKLLPLLIIPFLSFGQDCDLEDLTYVPDDNFESWIEANYPQASYGGNNDYVLSEGLDFGGLEGLYLPFAGGVPLGGPVFDLTGIEDFRGITALVIEGSGGILIEDLDISCIQLQNNVGGQTNWHQAPSLTINACEFLENLILPPDTFKLNINDNYSLNSVIFHPEAYYATINIGGAVGFNENLCHINIRGNAFEDIVLSINQPMAVDLFEFNSQFNGAAHFSAQSWVYDERDFNIRFNSDIYDWTSVSFLSLAPVVVDFSCVEVSDVSYCELYWDDTFNVVDFSNDCWSTTNSNDCSGIDLMENLNPLNSVLRVVDILGRETNTNKGFQLHIYDDGTVEKKYVIK